MSPHLRFNVTSAIIATGSLLSFTSCSTNKVAPLVADPKHEITYEVQVFDLPWDASFGSQPVEILSAEEGAKLLANIKPKPTFTATTGGRSGKTKTLSNKKDFTYPTAFDPPKTVDIGEKEIFPVTPAQPKKFKTTKLGSTVTLKGSKSPTGKIALSYEIERKFLRRLINHGDPITADATDFWGRPVKIIITENRMEKPQFGQTTIASSAELSEGDYLILRYYQSQTAFPLHPGRPTTEHHSGNFITLVRLATSKP